MIKSWLQSKLNAIWYQNQKSWLNFLLLPISYLYGFFVLKIKAHRKKQPVKNPVPVIVVGNITVGGSGKTPAIIALVTLMQQLGFKPGIISRGYPISPAHPILLQEDSLASDVGDEPLLIFKKTAAPVCVCKNRQLSINALVKEGDVNIIFSDDGLQNYSFQHDLEILLVDSTLGFGNGKLLPAGPLREPLTRIDAIDFLLHKTFAVDAAQASTGLHHYPLCLSGEQFLPLSVWKADDWQFTVNADYFAGKKVVAVTGIAHPEGFFSHLKKLGINCECYAFGDHYAFNSNDFSQFGDDVEIIMTEKDAIKCFVFAEEHFWCLPVEAKLTDAFTQAFLARLQALRLQQAQAK